MERLYLIRVGMERFLGPYTLKQVQEAYHRMQFGLQDEISGNLRPWVTFDNIEGVRRHYPEMVQLIHGEMMSGWGTSVPAMPSAAAKSRMRIGPNSDLQPTSKNYLWVIAFCVSAALILAFFCYRDGEFINPVAYMKDRSFYQAKAYLGNRYNPRFEGYMDRNRQDITQAMKKKKGLAQWIPYVRSVAFSKEGRWEGISPKKLRGAAEAFLPADCSVAAWDERWRDSRHEWISFLEGRLLPRGEWSRILTMDTHWIKNRSPMLGWLEPGSYHEACIRTALKSIVRLTNEDATGDSKVIISRLRWQLGAIGGNSPTAEYEMSGTLWAMSCLEDAHGNDDLKNCFNSVKVKGPFQAYFEGLMVLRRMALIVHNQEQVPDSELRDLQNYLTQASGKSNVLFLDYAPELYFYQEVVAQKGNVKAARLTAQKKYPSVHFQP